MILFAELRRYFWIEMTPLRMGVMAAAIALVLGIASLFDFKYVADAGSFISGMLLILWGTRLAADAVLGEVQARTWDTQRLSTQSPLALLFGKMFGSTIFVWFGAFCCLIGLLLSNPSPETLKSFFHIVLAGLAGQMVALVVSLLLLQQVQDRTWRGVAFAQVLGVLTAWILMHDLPATVSIPALHMESFPMPSIEWFGHTVALQNCPVYLTLFMVAWGFVAGYRLLRTELQYRQSPFVWTAFIASLIVVMMGVHFPLAEVTLSLVDGSVLLGLILALAAVVIAIYLSVFLEHKNPVALRRWGELLLKGDFLTAWRFTPLWGIAVVAALGLAIALIILQPSFAQSPFMQFTNVQFGTFALSIVLFALRDGLLITAVTLDPTLRRPHMMAAFTMFCLYTIAPLFFAIWRMRSASMYFIHAPQASPLVQIAVPLVHCTLALGILLWRAKTLKRD